LAVDRPYFSMVKVTVNPILCSLFGLFCYWAIKLQTDNASLKNEPETTVGQNLEHAALIQSATNTARAEHEVLLLEGKNATLKAAAADGEEESRKLGLFQLQALQQSQEAHATLRRASLESNQVLEKTRILLARSEEEKDSLKLALEIISAQQEALALRQPADTISLLLAQAEEEYASTKETLSPNQDNSGQAGDLEEALLLLAEAQVESAKYKNESETYRLAMQDMQSHVVPAEDYSNMVARAEWLAQQSEQQTNKILRLERENGIWAEQFAQLSSKQSATMKNYAELLVQMQTPCVLPPPTPTSGSNSPQRRAVEDLGGIPMPMPQEAHSWNK